VNPRVFASNSWRTSRRTAGSDSTSRAVVAIGLAAVARRKKLGKVGGTRYDMQDNASNIFKKWFEVQAMEDKS